MSATSELLMEQLAEIDAQIQAEYPSGSNIEYLYARRQGILKSLEATRLMTENKQILKG